MTENGFDSLNKFIASFDKIGALSSSAILAMICAALGYRTYKKDKDDKTDSENWRKTREDAVKAEIAQTDGVNRMADNLAILSAHIARLVTLIEERIPRRE